MFIMSFFSQYVFIKLYKGHENKVGSIGFVFLVLFIMLVKFVYLIDAFCEIKLVAWVWFLCVCVAGGCSFWPFSLYCIRSCVNNSDTVSIGTAEKGSFDGKLTTSSNPDVKDIDSDDKDPQLCSLYAPEIYNNLHVAEVCAVDSGL